VSKFRNKSEKHRDEKVNSGAAAGQLGASALALLSLAVVHYF
jgi:hypothetical protein